MVRTLRVALATLPRRLEIAVILLATVSAAGTVGYVFVEGWSIMDALYMTVITVLTIGYGEVRPLDTSGRILTMALAIAGVGTMFYALLGLLQFTLEGELASLMGVRRMKGQIADLRNHHILCGFGRVGEEIAREFLARHVPFAVVDMNPEAVERARGRGYLVVVGDGTSDATLKEAGVGRARCLLAASDSDAGNTFIVITAKALNPGLFTVARAANPESEPRMLRAGADRVFSPYSTAGRQMALSAIQPLVVEFMDTLAAGGDGQRILAEVEIRPESGLAGRTVHDVLHPCPRVIVLGIQRPSGEVDVGPPSTTVVNIGDRIIVVGPESELETIKG